MADTAIKTTQVDSVKEPLFGKKERKLLNDPLFDNNPITVQVLGICSALAVTTQMKPSIVMAIAVVFVLALSNVVTSLIRSYIPNQVRLIVQLIIIATLVTVVELTLKAISYDIYKQLSVFIGLIITNCIIMGRLEAFAMANTPWKSFLDGIGNGLGYGMILIAVSMIREFFGKGALMGYKLIGPSAEYILNTQEIGWLSWYAPNNLMVLPASALFIIGIFIWIHRSISPKLVDIS